MKKAVKNPSMSRQEAMNLYRGLQESVISILKRDTSREPNLGLSESDSLEATMEPAGRANLAEVDRLVKYFLIAITIFALLKGVLASVALFGVVDIAPVVSLAASSPVNSNEIDRTQGELALFSALDDRRAVLEQRRVQLEDRQRELEEQESLIGVKIAELRQLTSELRSFREAQSARKSSQVEQLAKVYVSMKPEEAAKLLQELDTMIAFDLISQMPEKRIGQLLSLIEPKKALQLTKLLTGVKSEP